MTARGSNCGAVRLSGLFGGEAQANSYLDNLTRDEYRQLYQAVQRLSKLALERLRSYTDFPDELPYDDLSGSPGNPD